VLERIIKVAHAPREAGRLIHLANHIQFMSDGGEGFACRQSFVAILFEITGHQLMQHLLGKRMFQPAGYPVGLLHRSGFMDGLFISVPFQRIMQRKRLGFGIGEKQNAFAGVEVSLDTPRPFLGFDF
jgi:hypothetical protein